jgi:glycosyltransferase involved in cell wall biosynthesis
MHITFFVFTSRTPVGGAFTLYQFANGLSRRGHVVHVIHCMKGEPPAGPEQLGWIRFEPGIRHTFTNDYDLSQFPAADFICPPNMGPPELVGLPFDVVQGYRIVFSREIEEEALRLPCPKICVARWLTDLVVGLGVPEHQVVYIPNGIDHAKFRVVTPIEARPPQVTMLYRNHAQKGPVPGLRALGQLKRKRPDVDVVVFSQSPPKHAVPDGIRWVVDPPQDELVRDIYNGSRIMLCSSVQEGFGMMCVEAMACGAALVTTDNGGSLDYAIDGETALVCDVNDVGAMVTHMETLLDDDDLRVRIAQQGRDYVQRFSWDAGATALESFLTEYGADPAHYSQPARNTPSAEIRA